MFSRISSRFKKLGGAIALLSVEMIVVICLFALAFVVFIYTVRKIFVLNTTRFDDSVFTFLKKHVSDRNNEIVQFFTFLGTHTFLIPANLLLIAYFLFIKKNKWYSIKIPAIALSSMGLMFLLKNIFDRPRPEIPLLFEAKGLSFPSGHALMSVTFFGLLIYIVFKSYRDKGWKWIIITLLILLIIMIGFTRVYLRVHYASDVIAGYSIGFLWLVFAIWILNRLEKYSMHKFNKSIQEPAVQPSV